MTIKVEEWADEESRTPNNSCYWYASCEIDGVKYVERSRRGAVNRLARKLVAAGIPDDRVEVWQGTKLQWTAKSMHTISLYTFAESMKSPLRRGVFVDTAARIGHSDEEEEE
jgi:hypothetical protein